MFRICLTMLLAGIALTLSSCKNEPQKEDPRVALVDTQWEFLPDMSPGVNSAGVSGSLYFMTQTDAKLTVSSKGKTKTTSITYSYDASLQAYPATLNFIDSPASVLIRVDWETNMLRVYVRSGNVVSTTPAMFFKLVK